MSAGTSSRLGGLDFVQQGWTWWLTKPHCEEKRYLHKLLICRYDEDTCCFAIYQSNSYLFTKKHDFWHHCILCKLGSETTGLTNESEFQTFHAITSLDLTTDLYHSFCYWYYGDSFWFENKRTNLICCGVSGGFCADFSLSFSTGFGFTSSMLLEPFGCNEVQLWDCFATMFATWIDKSTVVIDITRGYGQKWSRLLLLFLN